MSNYHWSLRYRILSIKLNEDKRAKPFSHEEEEEEVEEKEDGVEQFIKDGALK
jgi:preprotein translocase subunit Sec63